MKFKFKSKYKAIPGQEKAIVNLSKGIAKGEKINKIVIFDVKIGEETHKLKIM